MFVIWGVLENACMLAIFHYDFAVLLIVLDLTVLVELL